MPCFYFDISDDGHAFQDTDGVDLPSPEAARRESLRALVDRAGDALPDGNEGTLAVTVKDETGKPLFRATLTLAGEMAGVALARALPAARQSGSRLPAPLRAVGVSSR